MYFIGAAVQVHELLQETAASITLRPFVTPCSAAVRAQHLEYNEKRKKRGNCLDWLGNCFWNLKNHAKNTFWGGVGNSNPRST